MKKRKIIYNVFSGLLILGVITYFMYQKKHELPEPSEEVIAEMGKELEGLSLEQSIEKIQSGKNKLDFFLTLTSDRDETYNNRMPITRDEVRTTSGFSILSADEYEKEYNQYIKLLEVNQEIVYPNSIVSIFVADNEFKIKQLPKLTITKIVYKNGSYDDNPIQYKEPIELKTSKLIDSVEVSAKYDYIAKFDTYKIDTKTPKIKTDKFEIQLNKLSENYASFSVFGDIDVVGYNVLNAEDKTLAFNRKSSYGVGYQEVINDYLLGIYNLSKNKYADKSELVYQLARYRQKMNDELDRDFEIKYEGLYRGNTNSIIVYSPNQIKKNNASVTIKTNFQDEKVEITDEDNQTWGLIGNDGEFIIKDLPFSVKRISENYFYEKKLDGEEDDSDTNNERYELLKFDNKSNSLVKQIKASRVHIADFNRFIIERDNVLYLYSDHDKAPVQLEPKSGEINNIDFNSNADRDKYTGFFYIKDNYKFYIYNRDGKLLLPPERYDIDGFNEGVLQVKPDFFVMRELKPENKFFHYIHIDGSPTLTINNYDDANEVRDGLILVKKDDKYGFIDLSGNRTIPLEYESAYNFSEGYAYVKKDNLAGLIDKKGNVVIPLEYEDLKTNGTTNGVRYYSFNQKSYNAKELIEAINTEK
ncbi:TPA: WG repeat-containing protein [Providencia rettgeri]